MESGLMPRAAVSGGFFFDATRPLLRFDADSKFAFPLRNCAFVFGYAEVSFPFPGDVHCSSGLPLYLYFRRARQF